MAAGPQISGGVVVKGISAAITLCVVFATSAGWAQDSGPVFNKPAYNPASKSYIELVRLSRQDEPNRYIPSMNWSEAYAFASRRVYKGARGRLVVIPNAETHEFIMSTLRPVAMTWIGLRYFCNDRRLVWSTGERHDSKAFQAWHAQWDQSGGVKCQELGFMSVAYTSVQEGFRWISKGGLKLSSDMLIEYPTGQP
jgi:hypothetical protein